jgi:hypothetical protein
MTTDASAAPETIEATNVTGEIVRGWYSALLSVITPILVLGFLYSALADRLIFVGWALVVAAAYTASLRQGMAADWPRLRLAGFLALLLAAGFGWFAIIERKHHEILDLGFRAVFPNLYFPAATQPTSATILAGALALAGLVGLILGRSARPRENA